jgi:hypothetical protein
MSEQNFVIELGDEGRAVVEADDRQWLEEKLRRQPGSTRLNLRYDDSDTEGHGLWKATTVRVIAGDDDDTEGHAIAINFPTREEADAFRKRLIVTGVLAGTIALGAMGGIGLANLSSGDDAANAGTVQTTVDGSSWTQDERHAVISESTGGSSWTQDERPGSAVADDGASGSASNDVEQQVRGPQPR